MKEKDVKKVKASTEIVNVTSGILSIVNPIFSTIPLISFVINSVVGFVSEENIIKRIKKLKVSL